MRTRPRPSVGYNRAATRHAAGGPADALPSPPPPLRLHTRNQAAQPARRHHRRAGGGRHGGAVRVAAAATGATADDERFLRMAIDEARQADFPFGAVIVRDGAVIARAQSRQDQ